MSLSPAQKEILDFVAERYHEREFRVPGRSLRSSMSGTTAEKNTQLAAMVPGYLARQGKPPQEQYCFALQGALLSNHGHAYRQYVGKLLAVLKHLAKCDPVFETFSAEDIKRNSGLIAAAFREDQDFRWIDQVIRLAGLCSDPDEAPEGGPWRVPDDIEQVVEAENVDEFLALRGVDLDAERGPRVPRRDALSPEQQTVLEGLATQSVEQFHWLVDGIDLRKAAPAGTLDEKGQLVDSLCPVHATKSGNDHYGLTFRGLLASSYGERARRWTAAVLRMIRAKYDAEGAFNSYSWRELREQEGVDNDEDANLVALVIGLAQLAGMQVGASEKDGAIWNKPLDLELVLDIEDADQLVAHRERQAEDKARQREAKLNVNEIARRVLSVFGKAYEGHGRTNFFLLPENPAFEATGLSLAGRIKAFERLRDLGLLKFTGTNRSAMLTTEGVTALANPGAMAADADGKEWAEAGRQEAPMPDPKKVFIIHGRNVAARNAVEQFVKSLALDVLDFDQVSSDLGGSAFVGEVVLAGMQRAQGIVAVFTPDEYSALQTRFRGKKHRQERHKDEVQRWQARPNVIFEAGMAYGMDRRRTVLVTMGDDVSLFSDVGGVHIVRLTNATPGRSTLRQKLIGIGCSIDQRTDAWTDPGRSGDFEASVAVLESPNDPFAKQSKPAAERSEPSEADARIRLRGWLGRLAQTRAGDALEHTAIAQEAKVSAAQVRTLLADVAKTSASGWRVDEQGDDVTILSWLPRYIP